MLLTRQFNTWSDEEIGFLFANYQHMTSISMARHLERTPQAVESRLSILRKAGIIAPAKKQRPKKDVSSSQMKMNKEAVQSEVLFLLDFGDYSDAFRRRVKAGLAEHLLREPPEWFWARREWKLSAWMNYFHD